MAELNGGQLCHQAALTGVPTGWRGVRNEGKPKLPFRLQGEVMEECCFSWFGRNMVFQNQGLVPTCPSFLPTLEVHTQSLWEDSQSVKCKLHSFLLSPYYVLHHTRPSGSLWDKMVPVPERQEGGWCKHSSCWDQSGEGHMGVVRASFLERVRRTTD